VTTPQKISPLPDSAPTPGAAAWLRAWLPVGIALIVALLMQFGFPALTGEFVSKVGLQAGIAVILAVSLNIVNGYTGQFSIGHAGFFAIGAYAAAATSVYGSLAIWGVPGRQAGLLGTGVLGWGELLMVGGCVIGAIVAALAGYLVGLPSLRLRGDYLAIVTLGFGEIVAALAGYLVGLPSLRLRGDYLAIVTLGFGEIVRVLLQQSGRLPRTEEDELLRLPTAGELFPPPLGGAQGFDDGVVPYASLFWVYLLAGITCIVAFRLKQSSMGRAFLSIREDEIAARAMGVDIARYKVRAFVIAAFFAGIAGGLYAHSGSVIQPKDAGFARSFDVIIMVVLGGMGSISGAVVAALVLSALPELLRDFDAFRLIIYALLLIIMMIVRPQGLFGVREIWDLFPRRRAAAPATPPEGAAP